MVSPMMDENLLMLEVMLSSSCLKDPCCTSDCSPNFSVFSTTPFSAGADGSGGLLAVVASRGSSGMSLKSKVLKKSKSMGSSSSAPASRIRLKSSSMSSSCSLSPNGKAPSKKDSPSPDVVLMGAAPTELLLTGWLLVLGLLLLSVLFPQTLRLVERELFGVERTKVMPLEV